MKRLMVLLVVGLMTLGVARVAFADISAVSDGWELWVDPSTDDGLYDFVDPSGTPYLYQDWWWFRIGDSGGESSLDSLTLYDASNPSDSSIFLEYGDATLVGDATFTVDLYLDLTGYQGGPLKGKFYERLTVTSLTDSALDMHWFGYTDFDMPGAPGVYASEDDYADGGLGGISQWDGVADDVYASVTPLTPASHWEIGDYDEDPNIMDRLYDDDPTTLSDSGAPFGPGDTTFAFQWDFALAPYGTFVIEQEKMVAAIPEPASLLLLGAGLLGLGVPGIRKKKFPA